MGGRDPPNSRSLPDDACGREEKVVNAGMLDTDDDADVLVIDVAAAPLPVMLRSCTSVACDTDDTVNTGD